MKMHIGQGLTGATGGVSMLSPCGNRTGHTPRHSAVFINQEVPLSGIAKSFLGVSLHRPGWLNHWPSAWIQSVAPLLPRGQANIPDLKPHPSQSRGSSFWHDQMSDLISINSDVIKGACQKWIGHSYRFRSSLQGTQEEDQTRFLLYNMSAIKSWGNIHANSVAVMILTTCNKEKKSQVTETMRSWKTGSLQTEKSKRTSSQLRRGKPIPFIWHSLLKRLISA